MPLVITIPEQELYDSSTETFIYTKPQTITLEHSLLAIAKWESKWKKPFFGPISKTTEESLDYIRCMTITKNVDPNTYYYLPRNTVEEINTYMDDPMTATTFSDEKEKKHGKGKLGKKIVTAEEIYYMMTALNIPFECEKWHFNRLQTLIRVCSIKNAPPKKMSKRDVLNKYKSLNDARRKALNTTG